MTWIDGFAEPEESSPPSLPPARVRARPVPAQISEPVAEPADFRPAPQADLESDFTMAPERDADPNVEETEAVSADPDEPEYRVGYGKPPRHSQFKPGQSGNPRGRPRNSKGLNTIVRETLGSKVAVRTSTGTKHISKIEAVLQKTLEKAMKGDARAQIELMKLWRSAVPDDRDEEAGIAAQADSLTDTDLAMLDAYRAGLQGRADR